MAIQVLDTATAVATTAAAVTEAHAAPREAVPTADITGATPQGGLVLMIHHDSGPPGVAAISHGPAKCTDPITEAGLDPQGGTPVIDPILLIANIPSVPRGLPTGNDVKRVLASTPSHKPVTDQVAKISQICCC